MKKNRILMIGPSKKSRGGMATVIKNFDLASQFQLTLLETWTECGWVLRFIKILFTFRYTIRSKKIDIVHFHVAQNGSFFRKALLLWLIPKKTPTVFHMHASNFDKFYQSGDRKSVV